MNKRFFDSAHNIGLVVHVDALKTTTDVTCE